MNRALYLHLDINIKIEGSVIGVIGPNAQEDLEAYEEWRRNRQIGPNEDAKVESIEIGSKSGPTTDLARISTSGSLQRNLPESVVT